jgi:hypothetical protein
LGVDRTLYSENDYLCRLPSLLGHNSYKVILKYYLCIHDSSLSICIPYSVIIHIL